MYNKLFGKTKKFEVSQAEITYKVHYLGNVMTSLIKGTFCHDSQSNAYRKIALNERSSDQQDSSIMKNNANINQQEDDDDDDEILHDLHLNHATTSHSNLNTKINMTFIDKSVRILWENHLKHQGHAGIKMKLTLTQGGLKVTTRDHGLTEYYGHRIHLVKSHAHINPKLIVWVYQHVGKNLKSEIRCHAALCEKVKHCKIIESLLNDKLQQTFQEYKREKKRMQNSRLCNTKNGGFLLNQMENKKKVFRVMTHNYKPPVQHGMCSAPKLDDVIEEDEEEYNEVLVGDEHYDQEEANDSSSSMIEEEESSSVAAESDDRNTNHYINSDFEIDDQEEEAPIDDEQNCLQIYNYYNQQNNKEIIISALSSSSSSSDSGGTTSSPSSSSSSASSASNFSAKYVNESLINAHSDFKPFVEVSYDYLSDLSKCSFNNTQNNKRMSNNSRSFMNKGLKDREENNNNNNSNSSNVNFFTRSNLSRSFTAFTSRFNQQNNKDMIIKAYDNHPKKDLEAKFKDLSIINSVNESSSTTTNNNNNTIKNSLLSSPTLSTLSTSSSSYSSSSSNESANSTSNSNLNKYKILNSTTTTAAAKLEDIKNDYQVVISL
jgi:hypothetical protein